MQVDESSDAPSGTWIRRCTHCREMMCSTWTLHGVSSLSKSTTSGSTPCNVLADTYRINDISRPTLEAGKDKGVRFRYIFEQHWSLRNVPDTLFLDSRTAFRVPLFAKPTTTMQSASLMACGLLSWIPVLAILP